MNKTKLSAHHSFIKYLIHIVIGIGALAWFLFRVIPKPSRAAYPCQRVAFPIASSFVLWISGLFMTGFVFKRARLMYKNTKLVKAVFYFILALAIGVFFVGDYDSTVFARNMASMARYENANQPIGNARGIMPGRVVWVHNADATNESMTNEPGDMWWSNTNVDQHLVDSMLTTAICKLTNVNDITDAMHMLFAYYNQENGNIGGYTSGEKIMIKCNFQVLSWVDADYNNADGWLDGCTETSPQVILGILKLLVDKAGVNQTDIYIGDPVKYFTKPFYDRCHEAYPDVHYISYKTENGREAPEYTSNAVFHSSDGYINNKLPVVFTEAKYVINLAVLKTHEQAGVTSCAKNHFGTLALQEEASAAHLHYSLPNYNPGENEYRVLVDIMGHKDLGGKTILYLADGLWGGGGSKGGAAHPVKWNMMPFNGDYPSSIIVSLDPVAIESVCFDFCRTEFPALFTTNVLPGVLDYLQQAADSVNWPDGITYDPEGDGTAIAGSLGVFESWNNSIDKQYSRNLGSEAGIELIYMKGSDVMSTTPSTSTNNLCKVYPNPATNKLYIETSQYPVSASIYSIQGTQISTQFLETQTTLIDVSRFKAGSYYIQIDTPHAQTLKFILQKQ